MWNTTLKAFARIICRSYRLSVPTAKCRDFTTAQEYRPAANIAIFLRQVSRTRCAVREARTQRRELPIQPNSEPARQGRLRQFGSVPHRAAVQGFPFLAG